jgi:hypothetical protein
VKASLCREFRASHLNQSSGFDVTNLSTMILHEILFLVLFMQNLPCVNFFYEKATDFRTWHFKGSFTWDNFELVTPNYDSSIKQRIPFQQRPVFVCYVIKFKQNTHNRLWKNTIFDCLQQTTLKALNHGHCAHCPFIVIRPRIVWPILSWVCPYVVHSEAGVHKQHLVVIQLGTSP